IVTMEDILEELVGEIWDEHDEVEEDFEKLDENTYRVDCSVSLEDFMEFFGVKLESDSVSVGGWVMEQLNRVPSKGDSFTAQNLEITVSDLSAYRVSFITVRQCGVCLACEQ
ncbi:MAG: transporter associated domain-containing protein, partial [Oscillospiraceae bacterium]